ncbi:hypothetical protein HNR78_001494 [Parageobacillus toebii NBRC 107807]|uniref:Uncharacterized protein n=1 Tax=Parageobacillus toebii NBRC 107807 TaxID=1223503 RepID=A0AA89NJI3_9BACL|nr:hypothetical protein [Parageobacillus toebii NBRC 107807]
MVPIVSTYANKKRVIILLIDSLMYPPLEKAVKEGDPLHSNFSWKTNPYTSYPEFDRQNSFLNRMEHWSMSTNNRGI